MPCATFSSRFSFLNHCLIFVRAWLELQMFSQSRLGPLANYEFAMPSFRINTTLTTDAAVNGRLKMDTWQVLPKFALN